MPLLVFVMSPTNQLRSNEADEKDLANKLLVLHIRKR